MPPYDKLKSITQAANPEIRELSINEGYLLLLGCSNCGEEWKVASVEEANKVFQHKGRIGNTYCSKKFVHFGHRHYRPIRLADVLLAFAEAGYLSMNIDSAGGFFETPEADMLAQWNLKDDNLDHQSEETKQFLIELLV